MPGPENCSRYTRRGIMRRFLIPLAGAAVVVAGVAEYFFVLPALAAGPSLVGRWKLTFYPPTGEEISLCLLEFETKKGEVTGKVASAPNEVLAAAKLVKLDAGDKSLRFTIQVNVNDATVEIPVAVYFSEKD